MIESFLIGTAGSLTASFAFIYFLFFYHRPELRISPSIAKRTNEQGSALYTFKVTNATSYPLVDINFELVLSTPRNIPGGQINDTEILSTHQRFTLDAKEQPFEPFGNETSLTYVNLETKWTSEEQYLELRVLVRHGLTQFSRVFSQSYRHKSTCIHLGQFENGSFRVIGEG